MSSENGISNPDLECEPLIKVNPLTGGSQVNNQEMCSECVGRFKGGYTELRATLTLFHAHVYELRALGFVLDNQSPR